MKITLITILLAILLQGCTASKVVAAPGKLIIFGTVLVVSKTALVAKDIATGDIIKNKKGKTDESRK